MATITSLTELSTTPADNDVIPVVNYAAPVNSRTKKTKWSTIKASLKTVNDALYTAMSHNHTSGNGAQLAGTSVNFTQTGIGAVTRTIQSKGEDTPNVKDFGATGNGLTDDTAAIQAAIDAHTSIYVPPGTYKITSKLEVTNDNWSIIGVKGQSKLVAASDIAILGPSGETEAEYGHISGIYFTSATGGQGTGIEAVGPAAASWYLSHLTLNECSFAGHLKYGINGTMIACKVNRCDFGLFEHGHAFQAIRSIGQVAPEIATNGNVFSGCEFAFIDGVNYGIEMSLGYGIAFRDYCIFEQNTPTVALMHLVGLGLPSFTDCWFEANTEDSLVKMSVGNSVDPFFVVVDHCLVNCNAGPTTCIFDFNDCSNKNLNIRNTLFAQGSTALASAGAVLTEWSNNFSTNSAITALPSDGIKSSVITGDKIRSVQGVTASTANATPVTVLATTAGGVYQLTAWIASGGTGYFAKALVINDGAAAGLVDYVHAGGVNELTITVSGANIQLTQTSGGAQVMNYNLVRLN